MSWRENKIIAIIVGVVILVTTGIVILFLIKKETQSVVLVCEDTGIVFSKQIPLGAHSPFTCRDSGKKTAYLAGKYQCPKCGKSLILALKGQVIRGKRDAVPPEEMGNNMGYKCPDDNTPLEYRGRVWETSEERR